jgi:hypothetical protein
VAKRVLDDQTPDVDKLFEQLLTSEVLFIGFQYGNDPNAGLYLRNRDQNELESYMNTAGVNPIIFYAVPEDDM